jgi:hypothetical protein
MQLTITLSPDQISYVVDALHTKKSLRAKQIDKATRPSASAKLEMLALSDLITKFESAKPISVELPVLPESLG